ncbi:MAG: type IX secretion system outer membrane channel protein PorV [Bacteroidaceae bacterium]|nr:type IX secretion system outer membrane channel protein PorV [Bacteroidaceae bacterium]MBR2416744.1 type IX secretion system outer membrane channel protein PorV [Bacteroidaceae bacterium]
MAKNRIFSILLLAVLLLPAAYAQKEQFNPVYTGVTSLSIAPDARAGAMGDVGVATDPDVFSQYWNPAKYPFNIARAGVAMSYTPWLRQLVNDIDLINLAGFYRIGDYSAVSASLTYFSLGEVTMLSNDMTIKPYEMAVDVAYSRMLSEKLSAAIALRAIYSDLQYSMDEDVEPGKAFAADMALYYNNYIMMGDRECMLGLGMNISNIGTKISYDGGATNEFIPTNLRLGASLLYPIDEYNTISFSVDINKLLVPTRPTYAQFLEENGYAADEQGLQSEYASWLDAEGYNDISSISGIFKSFNDAPGGMSEELKEIYGGIGVEYCYNQQFSLRGGYHYENEFKGNRKYYTLGAGFRMSVFSLDAAYLISAAQSNPLDQTLRFSLSFDMDGLRDLFRRY